MKVVFLVAATDEQGIADAAERGWERIARLRFVTPEKVDVRVVRRMADVVPLPGVTPLVKGSSYENGPPSEYGLERWIKEKEGFDRFVHEGAAAWVEL